MSGLWLLLVLVNRAPAQDAQDSPDSVPELPAEVPVPSPRSESDGPDVPASESDPADEPAPTDSVEPVSDSEPPPPPPIPAELERAKEAYFNGGHEEAIEALSALRDRIDAGEVASTQVRAEIGIYLGEVLLLLKDQDNAWHAFRWLLKDYPDTPIQPALHPPEVVTWFEAARAEVKAEAASHQTVPPAIPVAKPLPVWGYAPLGIPQFGQKQHARGALYATGQTAAAGVSIGVFVHLLEVNRRGHPEWLADDEVGPYVRRWRNAAQWPSTAIFYSLWLASSLDARASWSRTQTRVDLIPKAEGAELRLTGRF